MPSLKNSVVNEIWLPWTAVTSAGLKPSAFNESSGSATPAPPIELLMGPNPCRDAPCAMTEAGRSAMPAHNAINLKARVIVTSSCSANRLASCEILLQRGPVEIDPALAVGISLLRRNIRMHHPDLGAALGRPQRELERRRRGAFRPLGRSPVLDDLPV